MNLRNSARSMFSSSFMRRGGAYARMGFGKAAGLARNHSFMNNRYGQLAVAGAFAYSGIRAAQSASDRTRNHQYGSAALSAGVSAHQGMMAYNAFRGNQALASHLAREGRAVGNAFRGNFGRFGRL